MPALDLSFIKSLFSDENSSHSATNTIINDRSTPPSTTSTTTTGTTSELTTAPTVTTNIVKKDGENNTTSSHFRSMSQQPLSPPITLPTPESSTNDQQLRHRKKEGKRQRMKRVREKRKIRQLDRSQEPDDFYDAHGSNDMDFDQLLALHESKKSTSNTMTTTHTTDVPLISHRDNQPSDIPTTTDPVVKQQGLPMNSTSDRSSSAAETTNPITKVAISDQDAAFVSQLMDSLSKGHLNGSSASLPSMPPLLQRNVTKAMTPISNQKGNNNKSQSQNNNNKKRRKQMKDQAKKKPKQELTSDMNFDQLMSIHETSQQSTKKQHDQKMDLAKVAQQILGKPQTPHQYHLQQKQQKTQQHRYPKQHMASSQFTNIDHKEQKQPSDSSTDGVCKYFLRGSCGHGDSCRYKHEKKQIPVLCRFYKSGSCGNGENCIFSHDLQLQPCRFLFVGGHCDAGDHCPFSHAPLTEESRKELHKMTGPCRFYHFKGYCTNGETCVFSHTEISNDQRHELEQTLTPCRHFHTRGSCPVGDQCFYLHQEASPESVQLLKASLLPKGGDGKQ